MLNHIRPKRVLLVAYLFPPVGGAGVQRAVKFVKYLPEFGWLPSVLTVANPSVPLFDESLTADVPPETIIRSAKTLEPSYAVKQSVSAAQQKNGKPQAARRLIKHVARSAANVVLQPDSQVLWMPDAVREGIRLLNEIHHDAILVTAPPFSSFLVGASLSRRTEIPLVLDYRDEWDISNAYWENKPKEPVSRWLQTLMQRRVVRAASALIATTRSSAESLAAIADTAGSKAEVTHIYNGYDADDFQPMANADSNHNDRYRLAYVGTLWNLTSVEPLVKAVKNLATERPDLAECLELVFAGRRTAAQNELLQGLDDLPCQVVRHEYLDHDGAVELMRTANGLCLLLSNVPHAGRVVPAKIFEYMAAGQTIFAIAPPGEVHDLLGDCPLAYRCRADDVDGITKALTRELERHLNRIPHEAGGWDASQYDRKNLAGELAEVLDLVSEVPAIQTTEQMAAV